MGARRGGSAAGVVVIVLLAALVWWQQGGAERDLGTGRPPGHQGRAADAHSSGPAPRGDAATDPASGLPWVAVRSLPDEARHTLALIDAGGPFPEDEDDETFGNFEGLLPDAPGGYYREYTVYTPGVGGRGARRIVTGNGGQYYWTADHYRSFARIRR